MPERETSEFNDALGYLNHITSLFKACSVNSIKLDASGWFNCLNALFRVLSAEMKEEEQKKIKDLQNKINHQIFILNKKMQMQISPSLYNLLQDYELFLRKIFKDSGLQNKMVEDAMKALR